MEASARSNLKPVSLELGGKSPLIIFDDADLDMAVELAISANFFNKVNIYPRNFSSSELEQLLIRHAVGSWQGEACVAASRVYVQESIYDRFEKKLFYFLIKHTYIPS